MNNPGSGGPIEIAPATPPFLRLHFRQNRLVCVLHKVPCARRPPLPTNAPAAFFSYSREDSEFVLRLAEDLKAAGAQVWLDQLDIEPGQRWARAVQDALNNSPRMLVILSPSAAESTHVDDEVNFALEEHKTVVPVLYRDCKIPFQLRPFQYVDFRTDYARGIKVLLKTLGVDQRMAASAAAIAAAKETSTGVSDEEERQRAEARALMEQAAEKARLELEQERKQTAEQSRLEEERKQAAEQARMEEERKRAAEEKVRFEQQERERLAAAEQARLEEERKQAAEQARMEEERKRAAEEKVRFEQQERERLAAAEQARLEEERRQAARGEGPART